MAARFRILDPSRRRDELSGDFLPKHISKMRRHLMALSRLVSFECDSLSEEWRRKREGVGRKLTLR